MMDYKVRRLTPNLTMTITYTREFRVRLWLAKTLFTLATKILGCGIEFEEYDDSDDDAWYRMGNVPDNQRNTDIQQEELEEVNLHI